MSKSGVPSLVFAFAVGGIVAGCASSSSLQIAPPRSHAATDLTLSKGPDTLLNVRRTKPETGHVEGHFPDSDVEMVDFNSNRRVPRYRTANLRVFTEEYRGIIIVLPGSILFAPNQTELLPEGRARLDDVNAVLLATRAHHITINGYTEPKNADPQNIELSKRQTNVVRDYIAERNYQPNLVHTRGTIDEREVPEFENADRRADKRRIEIVISVDERVLNR